MGNERRGKNNHLRENEIRLQKKIEAARKRKEEIEAAKKPKSKNVNHRQQKRITQAANINNQGSRIITRGYKKILQRELSVPILKSKTNKKRVFIVAGGESIKNLDLSLLHDEDTIVVNRTIFSVPNPTYFISMDETLYRKLSQHEITELEKTQAKKIFVANFASGNLVEEDGWIKDKKFKMTYNLYFYNYIIKANAKKQLGGTLDQFFASDNSGFGALQLALILGYEEIYLVGVDLKASSLTHFHGGYGENINKFNSKLKAYAKGWKSALLAYKGRSKIYSCSPDGALNTVLQYKKFENLTLKRNPNTPAYKPPTSSELKDLMVVGYYTKNTPYEVEAKKTIESCIKLGLNHDFKGIENLGNWQANTRYKAKFMLEMLDKHKGKNLLYVDCDSIVRSEPILFKNYNCDIAVRYQDFRWRKNECLSGTIYMENNEKTKKLCQVWLDKNVAEGAGATSFEQWNLGDVIQSMIKTDGLKFKNLPPEYTFIFDHMKTMYPGLKPIIEHFQASRKFKNKL